MVQRKKLKIGNSTATSSTGTSDLKKIQQSKDVNSFDAVALMKMKLDAKDPYLIYQISNGAMNNSSDYGF